MTGPDLDLDALREKAEKADGYHVLVHPDVLLSVLSLVDDLRAENERLREALTYVGEFARAHHHQQPAHVHLHGLTIDIPEVVERALAGPPADTKEQTRLDRLEWSWEYEPHERRITVKARARGQSVWRDVVVIGRAELR